MEERRQTIASDIEPGRATIQLDGNANDIYGVLEAPRPESFNLEFDRDGRIIKATYTGFSGKQVLEHISDRRLFKLNSNLMHAIVICLMVFSVVYLMARQYVVRGDRPALQSQQFLN